MWFFWVKIIHRVLSIVWGFFVAFASCLGYVRIWTRPGLISYVFYCLLNFFDLITIPNLLLIFFWQKLYVLFFLSFILFFLNCWFLFVFTSMSAYSPVCIVYVELGSCFSFIYFFLVLPNFGGKESEHDVLGNFPTTRSTNHVCMRTPPARSTYLFLPLLYISAPIHIICTHLYPLIYQLKIIYFQSHKFGIFMFSCFWLEKIYTFT